MPCLSPIWIKNSSWRLKSGHEEYKDERIDTPMIAVPCGRCVECRRKRRSEWRTRLVHEFDLGKHKTCWFVTLTFSDKYYNRFKDNPRLAIRLFLERWRKKFGKSLRHWFITELGGLNGRLHFHGLVFDARCDFNYLRKAWEYGYVWIQEAESSAVCSYMVKYITKDDDTQHDYKPLIFCSPGIGSPYLTPQSYRFHHSTEFGVFFIYNNGFKCGLPRYYKTKLFTEDEIRRYRIFLFYNPPDLFLRGRKYFSEFDYLRDCSALYHDSLVRGTSLPLKPFVDSLVSFNGWLHGNAEFDIRCKYEQLNLF